MVTARRISNGRRTAYKLAPEEPISGLVVGVCFKRATQRMYKTDLGSELVLQNLVLGLEYAF